MKNSRIAIRLPDELRQRIERYAASERRSISAWVEIALSDRVDQLDELAEVSGVGIGLDANRYG
jgi:predicted transcriptional regulator